ncbi:hypothetical protein PsorP6_001003 [Peronosclerospora sorghi]|uniref:Uncharacterized protein n=1 Tax=Peronosclerospora sorghi TaxID=230839 RepID=A0ACC0WTX9_9STRA|nr:hypothetical protein PsorP6_001003 [Peronosclerospora sorghi]
MKAWRHQNEGDEDVTERRKAEKYTQGRMRHIRCGDTAGIPEKASSNPNTRLMYLLCPQLIHAIVVYST